mgnify:FL=1
MKSKLKINTKVNNMQDIQKSLIEIEKNFNLLLERINSPAEVEIAETSGESGDIQVVENPDKTNTLYVKSKTGWKTPVIGNNSIKFIDKNKYKSTLKSIDEIEANDTSTGNTNAKKTIYDNKSDKFVLPRPDYDSGWVADATSSLTHNLGVQDFSLVYIAHNNDANNTTSNIFNNSGGSSPRAVVATTSANAISVTVSNGDNYYRLKLWK